VLFLETFHLNLHAFVDSTGTLPLVKPLLNNTYESVEISLVLLTRQEHEDVIPLC
jgi:hypothetical protein